MTFEDFLEFITEVIGFVLFGCIMAFDNRQLTEDRRQTDRQKTDTRTHREADTHTQIHTGK